MEQIEQRNPCIMNVTLGVREVYMFTRLLTVYVVMTVTISMLM